MLHIKVSLSIAYIILCEHYPLYAGSFVSVIHCDCYPLGMLSIKSVIYYVLLHYFVMHYHVIHYVIHYLEVDQKFCNSPKCLLLAVVNSKEWWNSASKTLVMSFLGKHIGCSCIAWKLIIGYWESVYEVTFVVLWIVTIPSSMVTPASSTLSTPAISTNETSPLAKVTNLSIHALSLMFNQLAQASTYLMGFTVPNTQDSNNLSTK